jgi:hypothetical protein
MHAATCPSSPSSHGDSSVDEEENDCFGNIVRNTTMKWIWFDNFEMDKHLIGLMMTTTTMMMPVTMLMVNEEAWGQKTSVSTDESNYTQMFMRLYMPPFVTLR